MGVSFASFEIPRSGLTVSQRALEVISHNIANVNTPGYVRQQAMITTGAYTNEVSKYGTYQLGLGADIQQIRQIRNVFLDNIYRQENTTLGYWESRNKTFQDVQAVIGDPMGSGLQDSMNQFWDSWQELSKDPDSLTVRALVRQRGGALVQQFNHMGEQLDKLQEDLNSEICVRIGEVNQITSQIANLNLQILSTEVSGDTANDYRDQRNVLVDRLTKLVNVDVTEMQDGQLSVTLGGYFLVNKGISTDLYPAESQVGGLFVAPKLKGTNIEVPLKNGIIKGLMESRGEVFGATGSVENGTPNTKVDIVFAVDVSDSSAAYLTNIKNNISSYISDLQKKGLDFNLRLVTYDGTGVLTNTSYGNDVSAATGFLGGINSMTPSGDTGENFGSLAAALGSIAYRENANKYAVVFTNESIDGNGTVTSDATVDGYIKTLSDAGIKTSIVTNTIDYTNGDAGERGWNSISEGTGGSLYDINTAAADYTGLLKNITSDINTDVNKRISVIEESNNIISDVRKRLNALINVMVREINNLHMSGKTLNGNDGSEFFCAINSAYPMEMGNIKLNDNLNNLNNLVASVNGQKGDNTIALRIANLRNNQIVQDAKGILSMDDYYQSIILAVGTGGSEAQNIAENQQKLVHAADSNRQSITGVSMDEEMSNMMKFKYSYDAASRVINAIDVMLDTVISKTGLAGR